MTLIKKKNGLDKTIKQNNEDKIFVGSYGYFKEKLEGFGCLFVDRVIYLKSNMFGYLLLRNVVKKDEKFKKENKEFLEKLYGEYNRIEEEQKVLKGSNNDKENENVQKECFNKIEEDKNTEKKEGEDEKKDMKKKRNKKKKK